MQGPRRLQGLGYALTELVCSFFGYDRLWGGHFIWYLGLLGAADQYQRAPEQCYQKDGQFRGPSCLLPVLQPSLAIGVLGLTDA